MSNLSVRRLDDETMARLRARAAQHGVSMEEEVRQILRRAVAAPERLGDMAIEIFGPEHGIDLQLSEHSPHQPPDLSE